MLLTVSGMCRLGVDLLRKSPVSGAGTTLSVASATVVAIMSSRGNQRPPPWPHPHYHSHQISGQTATAPPHRISNGGHDSRRRATPITEGGGPTPISGSTPPSATGVALAAGQPGSASLGRGRRGGRGLRRRSR